MGIVLEAKLVEAAVADVRADIQERIEELDPELTFEDYVRTRLALDPDRYRATLRTNQVHALTFERVVRGWVLSQERARVRLIICLEDDPVDEIQAALDAGRPFAEVAREFSRDPSRDDGGIMPPVVRTENMLLSRLAFSTAVGSVTGPVEDRDSVLWVLVEEFLQPVTGLWAEVAPEVEASLAEQRIDDLEILQWQQATLPFHEIDNRPFFQLVGEPIGN
jgi:parvulin-like peptidyl-prolyl isomerase